MTGRRAALAATIFLACAATTACKKDPPPAAADLEVRSTRGTVQTFDTKTGIVRIAHEDIPGYMKAMTMGFAVSGDQMVGVQPGDKVAFTFTETKDGPLRITAIKKAP
jgi:Cu/Ag efflux protein CusF